MSSLLGKQISSTYPGLIKTNDEAAIGATPKQLQDGSGNNLPVSVGTTSMVYTGTQDFSGASVVGIAGGSGTSGTSGTDGTSGVDGADGTSGVDGTSGTDGTSGSSGTSGGGGGSGTVDGKAVNALVLPRNVDTFYVNYYRPITSTVGNPTSNLVIYAFGSVNPIIAYPTTQITEGTTINEIAFFVQDASVTGDSFRIAIHDSELVGGELRPGDELITLTSNAALINTTGMKIVTGIGATVPATTSGTGVYFVCLLFANSAADSDHLTLKSDTFQGDSKYYVAQNGATQFSGALNLKSDGSFNSATYPTTGGFDIEFSTSYSTVAAIGFK